MEQNSYLSQIFCDYLDLIRSKPGLKVKYKLEELGEGKVKIQYIGNQENEITLNMMNGLLTSIKIAPEHFEEEIRRTYLTLIFMLKENGDLFLLKKIFMKLVLNTSQFYKKNH